MRPDARIIADLPQPDAPAKAASAALCGRIREEIERDGGMIPFRRYMELALYAPGLGYYAAGAHKLGAGGDFVTAPEVSPFFSRCLARQCAEVLETTGGDILEFGAGTGRMAADLLAALERLGHLPARYLILEVSPDLRERQHRALAERVPSLLNRVSWLDEPPAHLRGVVLANELFDAMPVDVFAIRGDAVMERCVGADDGGFTWRERPCGAALGGHVRAIEDAIGAHLPPDYVSEVNPNLHGWFSMLAGTLEAGVALFADYGYPRREYYHPQRTTGTLRAHYRHRMIDAPFFLPGLCDITADVDFTAVAEAAGDAGFDVAGFTTQAWFLMGAGLDAVFAEAAAKEPERMLEFSQQVKRLTLPGEMGERFHVIALAKGFDAPLHGFSVRDFRERL